MQCLGKSLPHWHVNTNPHFLFQKYSTNTAGINASSFFTTTFRKVNRRQYLLPVKAKEEASVAKWLDFLLISPWNTQTQSNRGGTFPVLTSEMHEYYRLERPIGARCIQNHPAGRSSTCQHRRAEAEDGGRRGQPGLRRGASLHFSTNTLSRKWSSPAAGGNQLVSDVIAHCCLPTGWQQSHGLAVRIHKHEERDWLVGWKGKGWDRDCDWSEGSDIWHRGSEHRITDPAAV